MVGDDYFRGVSELLREDVSGEINKIASHSICFVIRKVVSLKVRNADAQICLFI